MARTLIQFSTLVIFAFFVFQYIETTKQLNVVHDKFENEKQIFKQASFLNKYYDVNIVTVTVFDKLGMTIVYMFNQILDLVCIGFLILGTPFMFMVTTLGPFLSFLIISQLLH